MKKILIVFGTRPEAIKMASLVHEFKKNVDNFDVKVCVTAQHREMLDQVLEIFQIVPDFDMNIMQPNQDLFDVTSRIILGMRDVLDKVNPDLVFVHGDTTTSMAAALSAFYRQIPVAHVEAGLRTNNIYSPWPEEINRQMTGRIATYNLAPTERARQNLINENVSSEKIIVTGNTVIDALKMVRDKIKDEQTKCMVEGELRQLGYDPSRLCGSRRLILITGHRRENFGEGFEHICHAIKTLACNNPLVDFVYPVHLNPNVRQPVMKILNDNCENVFLINPLQYLPFVYLMEKSYLILTDSGGIQEEATALAKPILVMRNTTERPETIEAGIARLVGTNRQEIQDNVQLLLEDKDLYKKMSTSNNPYGNGDAAQKIVNYIKGSLK